MAEEEKCSYTAMQLQDGHVVQPVHVTVRTVFMHLLEKLVEIAVKKLLIIITAIMQWTVLHAVCTQQCPHALMKS